MKTDLEVIDGAIDLVSKDGGWCQGTMCRDSAGLPGPEAEQPVSFCLEGAVRYSATSNESVWIYNRGNQALWDQVERVNEVIATACGWDFVRRFNDSKSTTQEDAILALKTARTILEDK